MTRLAVDFGARFADFSAWTDDSLRTLKRPVTGDLTADLLAGLADLGLAADALTELRLVTTAPLNALLARAPQPVALITTRGFADTLRLGRQNRAALYDPVAKSPAPAFLVDPVDIFEVGGRIAANGDELAPLDPADIDAAVTALRARGIRSVALCLLFAHVNPAQELALAGALRDALPELSISLSHVVDPAPREYERTVSVLTDAWLSACMDDALATLRDRLAAEGFTGELLWGDGRGVLVPDAAVCSHRAILLAGAPAAAARAAATLADDTLIAADIGSLSADITRARGGQPGMAEAGLLAGVPLREACTDIDSIALGGLRRVQQGPRGLTFDATDAQAPRLDDALAALGRIPDGSEWKGEPAPEQVVAAAADRMAYALTRYATRRNIDPTRAALAVMGGSGALMAADIAAAMDLPRVLLPRAPGAAGAVGLMQAPRRREASARLDRPLPEVTGDALAPLLDRLEAEAEGDAAPVYTLSLAARPQMHPMQMVLASRPESGAQIAEGFGRDFRAEFGIAPPGPGYLFSLTVHRDAITPVPAMAAAAPGTAGLIPTEAGAIWCPEGWALRVTDHAYLLERSAT